MLLVQAVYEYKSSKTDEIILEEAKEDAHNQAHLALKTIMRDLNNTRFLAEEISTDLSSGKLKDDSKLRERLIAEMENNSEIFNRITSYNVCYTKLLRFFRRSHTYILRFRS